MAYRMANRSAQSVYGQQHINTSRGNTIPQVLHHYAADWQSVQQQYPNYPVIQQPEAPYGGSQPLMTLGQQGIPSYNPQHYLPSQQQPLFAGSQPQAQSWSEIDLLLDGPQQQQSSLLQQSVLLPEQHGVQAYGAQHLLPGQQQPPLAGPQQQQPSLVQQPFSAAGWQPIIAQQQIPPVQEVAVGPAARSPSPLEGRSLLRKNGRPRKQPGRKVGACQANACAGCRKAKVKCQRGAPGQAACTRCTDKGLGCDQKVQDMRTTDAELERFRADFNSWSDRWIRRFRVRQWLSGEQLDVRSTRLAEILAAKGGDVEEALTALYGEEGGKPDSDLKCPLPGEGCRCFEDTQEFLARCLLENAPLLADVRKQHGDFLQKVKGYVGNWDKFVGGR